MIRSVATKALALAMLAALCLAAPYYPVNPIALTLALAGYAALLCWRPHWWLVAVPALLPVLDLAPWTGWFFLDELDLLLMATCAVGYWRLGADKPEARLPRFYLVLLALFSCSFLVAAVIGMAPFPAIDANAFTNYNSPYNSLRVAKGLLWALLLLPLLRRSAGADLSGLMRYLVPGMIIGLALTALAAIWERATFPGLLDFASDYRPTAPFSAMHTGGAALDAYLAISFPFLALWLASDQRRMALALGVLLLAVYAGLATFSRDVYIAYGSAAAILVGFGIAHRLRRGTLDRRALLLGAVLIAATAWLLARMFTGSGYRGLLAALILLATALMAATASARIRSAALSGVGAALALALCGALYLLSGKGAYLAFAFTAVLAGGAALLLLQGEQVRKDAGMALMAAALPAMAASTALIALHWGGTDAAIGTLPVLALAGVLIALNRLPAVPVWQAGKATLAGSVLCAIVFAVTIPIAGSYYTGSRFATVGADIGVRLGHWSEALAMRDSGLRTSVLGMGLGLYPATYYWKNTHGETPGSYGFVVDGGRNQLLRLGPAQYADNAGDVLRMLQHVALEPGTRYRLAYDLRRTDARAYFSAAVCERWLLYPQNCVEPAIKMQAADGAWHRHEVEIVSGKLGRPGVFSAPVQLEMSALGRGFMDVDNVSLVPVGGGADLVRNGSFSSANDYWFFSSDRNHFPWHVKNFWVNVVFEQGWAGLAAVVLLLGYVAGSLAARALHGELPATVHLAALVAFVLVGLFDSLFDVPRLTLIFFLVASAACLLPPRQRRKRRSLPATTAAPA